MKKELRKSFIPSFGKGRIARRLVIATIIFSSFITLSATSYQLYADYRQDLKTIHGYFTLIENSYLKSLSRSVWMYDVRQVTTQLDGLIKLPGIEYLEIKAGGDNTWSSGKLQSTRTITRHFPLSFRHKNQTFSIGTLNVTTSLDNVYDRLIGKAFTILVINAIRAFFVSGFILLIFHLFVTRHLVELADFVNNIDLNRIPARIRLKRKKRPPTHDEIDQVVHAFNQMQVNLQQSYEVLQEREAKYRSIFENAVEGLFQSTPEGRFVSVNPAFSKMLSYASPEDLVSSISDIATQYYVDPEDRLQYQKLLQENGTVKNFEFKVKRKDGSHIWVSNSTRAIYDQHDKIVCYEGNVGDITGRKLAEHALSESEKRYRRIFENIQDVYYEASMDGTILEISPSIENVSEYKRKELIGKSLYDIYRSPEERDELLETILESGKVANFEVHLTDKDGSQYSIELNSTLQRDQKGNPIKLIGSMRDISERKRLEARLLQSQKMETVGTLAGGTAHEFNNILGTIIGNTEMAKNDVPESNPARECLEEIQTASLRAKDVVRQLLGFARKSVFQLIPVQISPIVHETLKMLRDSIPTTIEIRRNLSCKSDTVMADSTQISQVLMNLCTNAKNAMQAEGGVLEVELKNIILDGTSALLYEDLSPGNYVKLTVKDSGQGIDPGNIDQIFDPYFTTMSLAEGTGMGLAVVHGIVKHHNAAITVASEPGKGTLFEVLFPLIEAEAEQEAGVPEAVPTGNEKILLVDDEASLVKMVKRMLEMQGYQVETKGNPVEALELVRLEPDRFDLIITDMTMPQMTGDKLTKEILSIRPDMPIILCSGFSEKIDAEKAKGLGIRKYIEKPLDMSDFVADVRKVLDK